MPKKPPDALVPMERLKEIVKGIIAVPRAEIEAGEEAHRARPRKPPTKRRKKRAAG